MKDVIEQEMFTVSLALQMWGSWRSSEIGMQHSETYQTMQTLVFNLDLG